MKNSQAISYLFIANFISSVAQGLSMIAIPWYFAQRLDMGRFGLIYILANVVSLFWVPYAGTLIDKFDRKNLFLFINIIWGALIGGIALIGHSNGSLPWYLVAGVFMITFFNYNIHYPNLHAFVQEIIEEKHYGKITSLLEIQGQFATMLSGAAGALLLEGTLHVESSDILGYWLSQYIKTEAWTIYEIFTLDAFTYLIAFCFIYLIRYSSLKKRTKEVGNTLARVKSGWNYLTNNRYILLFGVLSYSVFAVILIEGFYLGAIYVNNHLHATGGVYALSEIFYAIGAVLSGISIQMIFRKMDRVMSVTILTFITALAQLVMAFSQSIPIFYAILFFLGLTNAGVRILRVNYLFRHVPAQVYGRASSVFFIFNSICRIGFIGMFSFAFFQRGSNVTHAFSVLFVFLLISGLLLVLYHKRILQISTQEIQK